MAREITHRKTFTAALESTGKGAFTIGKIEPTPGLVNQYFNDSSGSGENGDTDARGPWNQGGDREFVNAPAFQDFDSHKAGRRKTEADANTPGHGEKEKEPPKRKTSGGGA
jgi:Mn-containing catalase